MVPVLLVAFLVLMQSPTGAKSDTGAIEGIVSRADTRIPISGAEILAIPEGRNSPQSFSVVADENGRFRISDVPPGRYRVSARHTGFSASVQSHETITVRKREQIRNVGLVLFPPPGRIQGKVVLHDGSSLQGVSVELVTLVNWGGLLQLHRSGHETKTNSQGEYRVEVPLGNYYVRTTATTAFARTYFPDKTEASKAVAVQVREDLDTTADIHPSQAPFKISGRVVDPHPGAGDREVSIYLANRGATLRDDGLPLRVDLPNAGGPVPNAVLTDLTQPFEIGLVSPGAYDLHVLMFVRAPLKTGESPTQYRPPTGYYVGQAAVDVKDRDVTGVEILPGNLIDVKMQIISTGKTIEKVNQTLVHLMPLDSSPFNGSASEVDKNGRFTAHLREGSYRLGISLVSRDAYVVDVLQGGKSILDSGLVVTRAANESVQVIVNPKGAVIRGSVSNGPEALIYLTATKGMNTRGARASKTGDFTLTGVAPGDYLIFAFPLDRKPEWSDPDFLIKYGPQGIPITVKNDAHVTITLPVSRP